MCFEIPVCLFFNYLITPEKKNLSLVHYNKDKSSNSTLSSSVSRDFFNLSAVYPIQTFQFLGFKSVMNPVVVNSGNIISG